MKKKLNRQIFLMAVLGLVVAVVWIYLSVFKIVNKPDDKPILSPQETKVVIPKLDQEVFDELEKRNF